MAERKEIMIAMDPHMAAKFSASSHVSCKYQLFLSLVLLSYLNSDQGRFGQHAEDQQQATKNS